MSHAVRRGRPSLASLKGRPRVPERRPRPPRTPRAVSLSRSARDSVRRRALVARLRCTHTFATVHDFCRCVMPSSPRRAMTVTASLVVASLFAALLMPLASHSSNEDDSRKERADESGDSLCGMFWTLWKGSEVNGAAVFAARLRRNWRTVGTTARRQWWRRSKQRQTCQEDASDPQIQAARGLLERNFAALQSKIRFSRDVECDDARSGGCFTVLRLVMRCQLEAQF